MGTTSNLPHKADGGPEFVWTTSYNLEGVLEDARFEAEIKGEDQDETVDLLIEAAKHIVIDVQKYLDSAEDPTQRNMETLYPLFSLLEDILAGRTCGCDIVNSTPCKPENLLLGYIPQGNGMYKDSSVGKLRLESAWYKYNLKDPDEELEEDEV